MARRAAVGSRHALARHAQGLPVVDAGGDVDHHRLLLALDAAALALGALVLDDPPAPAAAGAGGRDHEDALVVRDLTAPATGAAGRRLRTGLAARAGARLAVDEPRQLQRLLAALGRLAQRDGQLLLQVVALLHPLPAAAPLPAAEPEAAAEEVGELRQDVLDAREPLEPGLARPGVPIAVVELALLRVGEHLVGLRQLLEALLGVFVSRVAIGMVLHRKPAVRLLDLGDFAAPLHAEHFIVIAFLDLHSGSRHKLISTAACVKAANQLG
jgi:hypothetical protein